MATERKKGARRSAEPTPKLETSLERRRALLAAIEKERGTKVIAYVTSTRPNLEAQMAQDVIRYMYEHLKPLRTAGEKPKIDLFLYSNGGDTTVPWRLVALIREFTDRFSVLVPFRAFSAATLAALGANEIVMHPMGTLGPTDPTITNEYTPRDPANPQRRLGVSVEDVTAYLQLVKEDAGITHEDELVQAFNILAQQVHPLALGNVKRIISQARILATKLLSMHMSRTSETHKIQEIVESLTSKLFFHGHPINRKEAREQVGLTTVQDATDKVADLMWALYLEYEDEMKLLAPFNPAVDFTAMNPGFSTLPPGSQLTSSVETKVAYVESSALSHVSEMAFDFIGMKMPDNKTAVTVVQTKGGWSQV